MKTRVFWLKVATIMAVVLLMLAGCLPAGAPTAANSKALLKTATPSPQSPGDRLVVVDQVGTDLQIRVLDTGGKGAGQQRPLGYISPDGATLYALENGQDATIVRAFDVESGQELRQMRLAGQYFVPAETTREPQLAISRDGQRMILSYAFPESEAKGWEQTGKPRTRFAVLDTDFAQPPIVVDLEGVYWYDTLSRNGRWLYLMEVQDKYPMSYSPDKAPNYQVRAYDVENGRLMPDPVVDKSDPEQMTGYRYAEVFSLGGDWLFSLYTRPRAEPFVHALNLENHLAVCIDLPFEPSSDWEADMHWAMAMSRDGRLLYAVNGITGQVAQVDTSANYAVRQSATLPSPSNGTSRTTLRDVLARIIQGLAPVAEAKMIRIPAAVLSSGGETLFALGAKGILAINTSDLTLRGRYLPDLELNSLALSPDGERLYTVRGTQPNPSKLLAVDPHTGALLGEVDGAAQPRSVLRADQ